ncbi:hypothetical protein N431DRAFT_161395 [Stipitochalara longipes BDJ]|nr:hypothetical protein N431DRAFT_161395 [Stipitochalara longipes BDJ]
MEACTRRASDDWTSRPSQRQLDGILISACPPPLEHCSSKHLQAESPYEINTKSARSPSLKIGSSSHRGWKASTQRTRRCKPPKGPEALLPPAHTRHHRCFAVRQLYLRLQLLQHSKRPQCPHRSTLQPLDLTLKSGHPSVVQSQLHPTSDRRRSHLPLPHLALPST